MIFLEPGGYSRRDRVLGIGGKPLWEKEDGLIDIPESALALKGDETTKANDLIWAANAITELGDTTELTEGTHGPTFQIESKNGSPVAAPIQGPSTTGVSRHRRCDADSSSWCAQ